MTQTTGALPTWNLKDFYDTPKDPKIQKDLDTTADEIEKFQQQYAGKLEALSGDAFYQAIARYEELQEQMAKPYCYASLLFAENMNSQDNGAFFQTIKERINAISTNILFFTLEINELSEEHLETLLKESAELKRFQPWLRDVRVFQPYQLPQDQEKLLHEMSIASRSNWVRLHEEVMAATRFSYEEKKLPITDIMNLMINKEGAVRKKAALAFSDGLEKNIATHSLVINTLMKEKSVEDSWRGFSEPICSRNLANLVEDDVVDSLLRTVKGSYGDLSHRYYKLKAKWMGVEKLPYWDRNAPLPEQNSRLFTWPEAREKVLGAYHEFSPKMASIGEKFFAGNWIDAAAREGKDSGAFSHGTIPSLHPYILTQFHGKMRDVATLAHELGHGIHQYLAREQGYLLADTPLTVAETASVFGEMLTFQSLLKDAKNDQDRKVLIAGKVEDMLNTVVRQIAFCDFEKQLHAARLKQELSADEIGKIWLKTQREALGPIFDIDEKSYQYYWSYVSHFIHTPFYVYAYAFGDCLVNTLYATYQAGYPDFQARYLQMLSAGGSMRYQEMLDLFGLDASTDAFWKKGLGVISGMIDILEDLS